MTSLCTLLLAATLSAADPAEPPETAAPTPKGVIAELSARQHPDAKSREAAIVQAALADLEAVKRSPSPMTGWTAQLLLKAGRKEEGLAIVRAYIGERIKEAKARMADVEKRRKAGTYVPFPLPNGREWGEPHVNGFGLWSMEGIFPFAPSLDTLGFFTATAGDMAALWPALGHHVPAAEALLAASGPATPSMAPWPNSSGFADSRFSVE